MKYKFITLFMEPTTYFTDRQKLVLNSLWQLCLIYAFTRVLAMKLPHFDLIKLTDHSFISSYNLIDNLAFVLIFCWEFIVGREFKKVILIALFYIGSMTLYSWYHTTFSQIIILNFAHYIYLGVSCLQFTIIYLIGGKRHFWKLGPAVGLFLFYTIETLQTPWNGLTFSFIKDLLTPVLVYGALYLTENKFKPAPGSKYEYGFLVGFLSVSLCYVVMESYGLNAFDNWTQHHGHYLWELPNMFMSQVLFIFILHLLYKTISGKSPIPWSKSVLWICRGILLLSFVRAVLLLGHANFKGLLLFMILVLAYYTLLSVGYYRRWSKN